MNNRLRQIVILATAAVCLFYLAYRALFTLNFSTGSAAVLSVALLCAETFGIVSVMLFFVQVWEVYEPPQEPILDDRSVDIFVPTYNEDPLLLRATLEACRRLDYPHKTYLCDDGGTEARYNDPEKGPAAKKRREELQALCAELDATYMTRPDNRHAKAGNLNYAFTKTDGEFLIIFDADHVPEPHFISRLIGYFKDEKLGFIQTPHAFYNFECFQSRLNHRKRQYWEEGQLFYAAIQPGRNKWNCPIFAGSAAMFRRKALEEVGWIAVETITEDMHTGMRMNARGWKSLGISERMVAGQAAPDITTFHVQRLRWGEGNLSIMAYDNPLWMRGLSFMQRLCYLGSMIHWAGGIFKLVIYLTPLLMLFTGVSPVYEFTWFLFGLTFVYLFFSIWGVQFASNGYGSVVYGELFCMVNFWTQVQGLWRATFMRKFQSFVVTSKRGRQSNSVWPFIKPQVYLAALSIAALVWGWSRVVFGVSDDYFKPILPTFWTVFHLALMVMAVRRALWPEDRRFGFRHVVNLPIRYELVQPDGLVQEGYAVSVDLSETGIGLVVYEPIPAGSVIDLYIDAANERVQFNGQVRWAKDLGRGRDNVPLGTRCGVKFAELPVESLDVVNRLTLHYGVARLFDEYAAGNRRSAFAQWRELVSKTVRRRRFAARREYFLPGLFTRANRRGETTFVTEDIHQTAFAALLDESLSLGDQVEFQIFTPFDPVTGRATVIRKERRRHGARHCWLTAFEYTHLEGDSATTLHEVVGPKPTAKTEAALRPDRQPLKAPVVKQFAVGLAAALVIGVSQIAFFPFFYRDELFLRSLVVAKAEPSEMDRARFDRILSDTLKQSYPSNDRLVLLMACLPRLDRLDDTGSIMQFLAPRDRTNLNLQLALAQAFDTSRDYSQAEAEYQRLLKEADRNALPASKRRDFLVAAARSSVHGGDMERAVQRFEAVAKEFPEDAPLRNEFAGVLISAGKYAEVPKLFAKHEPDAEGRMLLMSSYAMNNDFEAAEKESRIIVAANPNDAKAKKLLADILSCQKNFLQSRALYERLQKENPTDPQVRVKLAEISLWSKNYDEALTQFVALWNDKQRKREVVRGLIDAASAVRELPAEHRGVALQLFEQMQADSRADAAYLARLAWVLERYREFDKSMELLERAWTMKGDDKAIRKQFFALLYTTGRQKEAMELLQADRDDPETRRLLVEVHLRRMDFKAAEQECRAIVGAKNDDADSLRTLADLLSWQGQHKESLELFERLKALRPTDATIPVRIAEVTLWSRNFDRAVELFEKLLEENFDRPAQWRDYIDATAAAKNLRATTPDFVRRIAKAPATVNVKDAGFFARLAWALLRIKEPNGVDGFLDRALALKPTDVEVRKSLIGTLASAKRGKEALDLYEQLPVAAKSRRMLAQIHCGMQNFAAAEREYRAELVERPGDLEIERALADVLAWKGDYAPALELLERLRTALPADDTIPVRIAETTLWKGDVDAAVGLFAQLLAADVRRPDYWSGFADAVGAAKNLTAEDLALGVRVAQAMTAAASPPAPTTASRLAWALVKNGRLKEADGLLEVVVKHPPTDPGERREVGGVLAAAKRVKDALKMFEGLTLTADDRLRLAALHASQKDFPAALAEVDAVLKEDAGHRPAKRMHADVLSWMGKHREALGEFSELQRLEPNDATLAVRIAETTLWSGDAERALAMFMQELDRGFDRPAVQVGFVDAAAGVKTLPPGVRALAVRLAQTNALPDAVRWSRLSWILSQAGETAAAKLAADRALANPPKDLPQRLEFAGVLATLGRPDDALALLKGFNLSPADRMKVANLYAAANRHEEAANAYLELLGANYRQPELWKGFANAAAGAKQLGEPARAMVRRLAKEPAVLETSDHALLSRLAWALVRERDKDAAKPLLDRAASLPAPAPEIRRELAGVLAAAGRGREAIALYRGLPLKAEDRLRLAEIHASVQDFVAAEAECRAVLAERPTDAVAQRLLADLLSWSGKHRDALDLFDKLLKRTPTDVALQVRIAETTLWSGDAQGAFEKFRTLANREPTNNAYWVGLVDAAASAQPTENDMPLLDRIAVGAAAGEGLNDAARLSRLAWTLYRAKRPAALIEGLLARAVTLDPKEPAVRKELGGVLAAAGRFDDAFKYLSSVPPDAETRRQLAWLNIGKKNWEAAEADARALLAERPDDPQALRMLAEIHAGQGRQADALALWERLVQLAPNDATTKRRLAETALWSGQTERALGLFEQLAADLPDDPQVWKALVDAAAATRELSPGLLAVCAKLATSPRVRTSDDVALLSRLSWVLVRAGKKTDAAPLLDRAQALPTPKAPLAKEFAGVLAAAGRGKAALAYYANVALDDADRLRLASIHSSLQDFAAAEREIRFVLAKTPDDAAAQRALADVLSWKGDHAKALELFAKLHAAAPDDADLAVRIAETTLWSGAAQAAVELFAEIARKRPTQRNVWPAFVDAASAAEALPADAATEAKRIADAALAERAELSTVFFSRLAWVLVKLEDKPRAERVLDAALTPEPTEPALRKELAGVLSAAGRATDAIRLYKGLTLTADDRLRLASLHAARKDFASAEAEVRGVIELDPKNFAAKRLRADLLSWKGDYAQALEQFEALRREAPTDRSLTERLAEIALWKGDCDRSVGYYEELLDAKVEKSSIVTGFLHAAAGAKKLTDKQGNLAADVVRKHNFADSKDGELLTSAGWLMHSLGRTEEATSLLVRAASLPIASPEGRKRLAGMLEVVGRPKDAIALYRGIVLGVDDRLRLAGLFTADRDFASAKRECEAVLKSQPRNLKARRLYADVLSWNGEHAKALERFAELRTENPNDAEIPLRIAETTLWARQYDRAIELFAEILERDPRNLKVSAGFVDAAASANRLTPQHRDLALRLAEAAIVDDRTTAVYCSRLAWVLYLIDDKTKLHPLLDAAIARAPQEPPVRRELAGVLTAVKRTQDAARLFDGRELELEDRLKLAGIHAAANEFDKAETALRAALAQTPDDVKAMALLGDVLIWQRKHDDAVRVFGELLKRFPDRREFQLKAAQASLWSGRYDAALERIGALLRADPESRDLWPLYVDAAASAKLFDAARHRATIANIYNRIAEDPKPSAIPLVRLAWVLKRAGENDKCIAVLKRSLAQNPGAESVRVKLADALSEAGRYDEAREQYDMLLRKGAGGE